MQTRKQAASHLHFPKVRMDISDIVRHIVNVWSFLFHFRCYRNIHNTWRIYMEDNSHVRAGTWQRRELPCPQHAGGRGLHQRLGCHSAGPGAGENAGKPKGCCRKLCAPLGMKGRGMATRGPLPAPVASRTAAELHGVAQRRQRPPLPEGPDLSLIHI